MSITTAVTNDRDTIYIGRPPDVTLLPMSTSPITTGVANVRLQDMQQGHRSPSVEVNISLLVAEVENIHIQVLLPHLATARQGSADADIETIHKGLSRVHLQKLLKKRKGRAIEIHFSTAPRSHSRSTNKQHHLREDRVWKNHNKSWRLSATATRLILRPFWSFLGSARFRCLLESLSTNR